MNQTATGSVKLRTTHAKKSQVTSSKRESRRRYVAECSGTIDWLERQRRLVAAPRIEMLTGHIGQSAVALDGRCEPMDALKVRANEILDRIACSQSDANTKLASGMRVEAAIMTVADVHRPL